MVSQSLDELTQEQLEVVNCEVKTTFISGWNREQTFNLVCHKTSLLFEGTYLDYPDQLSIVLENERDISELKKQLPKYYDGDLNLQKIKFSLFKDFKNEFFYERKDEFGRTKLVAKATLLGKNARIVFFIDVKELHRSKQDLRNLSQLFSRQFTTPFFWQYESDILLSSLDHGFTNFQKFSREELKRNKDEKDKKLKQYSKNRKTYEILDFYDFDNLEEEEEEPLNEFEKDLILKLISGNTAQLFDFVLKESRDILSIGDWDRYFQFNSFINNSINRLKEVNTTKEKEWIVKTELDYLKANGFIF